MLVGDQGGFEPMACVQAIDLVTMKAFSPLTVPGPFTAAVSTFDGTSLLLHQSTDHFDRAHAGIVKLDVTTGESTSVSSTLATQEIVVADGAYVFTYNDSKTGDRGMGRILRTAPYLFQPFGFYMYSSKIFASPDGKSVYVDDFEGLHRISLGVKPTATTLVTPPPRVPEASAAMVYRLDGTNLLALSDTAIVGDGYSHHERVDVFDANTGSRLRTIDASKRNGWLETLSILPGIRFGLNATATALYGIESCDATHERFVRVDASGTADEGGGYPRGEKAPTFVELTSIPGRDSVLAQRETYPRTFSLIGR